MDPLCLQRCRDICSPPRKWPLQCHFLRTRLLQSNDAMTPRGHPGMDRFRKDSKPSSASFMV
jgi:hypothetical protein